MHLVLAPFYLAYYFIHGLIRLISHLLRFIFHLIHKILGALTHALAALLHKLSPLSVVFGLADDVLLFPLTLAGRFFRFKKKDK